MGRPRKREIEVRIFWREGRGYTLWWLDPLTGKQKTRAAQSANRTDATREALELEADLKAGRGLGSASWAKLRTEAEKHYPRKSARGWHEMLHSFNKFEALVGSLPDMSRFIEGDVREYSAKLKALPLSDASVKKHLRNLRALLNWGRRQKLLATVPYIEIPPDPKGYGGKADPATDEEIELLCDGLREFIPEADYPTWERAIWGTRYSGLRLGEMMRISWDRPPVTVEIDGKDVAINWQAGQKSGKYETSPTVPAFAKLILKTPPEARTGPLFCPTINGEHVVQRTVEKNIARAAAAKGIKISLHNLRRSFADEWYPKVDLADLADLMRCGINVIRKFYAKRDAIRASRRIRLGSEKAVKTLLQNQKPKKQPSKKRQK